MLVSNWEILLKRIAPAIPNTPQEKFARVSVQGYFLTITNLEDRPVFLKIYTTFNKSVATPQNPFYRNFERELFDGDTETPEPNYIYSWDIIGGTQNGQTNQTQAPVVFNDEFNNGQLVAQTKGIIVSLPAFRTGSFKLLPNVVSSFYLNRPFQSPDPSPGIEVRGYCEVFPSLFQPFDPDFGDEGGFPLVPEEFQNFNADILITPEYRSTILPVDFIPEQSDNDFSNNQVFNFGNVAYSLPTAQGGSLFQFRVEDNPEDEQLKSALPGLPSGKNPLESLRTLAFNNDAKTLSSMVKQLNGAIKNLGLPLEPLALNKEGFQRKAFTEAFAEGVPREVQLAVSGLFDVLFGKDEAAIKSAVSTLNQVIKKFSIPLKPLKLRRKRSK